MMQQQTSAHHEYLTWLLFRLKSAVEWTQSLLLSWATKNEIPPLRRQCWNLSFRLASWASIQRRVIAEISVHIWNHLFPFLRGAKIGTSCSVELLEIHTLILSLPEEAEMTPPPPVHTCSFIWYLGFDSGPGLDWPSGRLLCYTDHLINHLSCLILNVVPSPTSVLVLVLSLNLLKQ